MSDKQQKITENEKGAEGLHSSPVPCYKVQEYNIVYADPPWSYDDKAMNRGGAERHYKTMDIDSIKKMPIDSITADDCALFIWGTWPKLQECMDVITAWGFTFKTCAFVWVKTNKRTDVDQYSFLPADNLDSFWGMGRWTRANTEYCLLAVKGKPQRQDAGVHQIIYAPIMGHSKKPDETRDKIIKLCGDIPRIELFARNKAEGWSVWGNEVETDVNLCAL